MVNPIPILFLTTLISLVRCQSCVLRGICYALDQSGSIDDLEYQQERNFTVNSARQFQQLNDVSTEYSAAFFTGNSGVIQEGTTDLEGVFVPAINDHNRTVGGTDIFQGIRECATLIPDSGERVIVVVTDGQGSRGEDPTPALKNDGVAIVSVGVGDSVDVEFLAGIATTPSLYFPVSFANLPGLSSNVTEEACKVIQATPTPTTNPPTPTPTMNPPSPTPTANTPPVEGGACSQAFEKCKFTLGNANTVPSFNSSSFPDIASIPITNKDTRKRIGVVNSQAGAFEPVFIDDATGNTSVISNFGSHPFSPTAFKAEVIPGTGTSGIAHEVFQGDQYWVADGRCVQVFFNSYQLLLPTGGVAGVINLQSRSDEACVVFKSFL